MKTLRKTVIAAIIELILISYFSSPVFAGLTQSRPAQSPSTKSPVSKKSAANSLLLGLPEECDSIILSMLSASEVSAINNTIAIGTLLPKSIISERVLVDSFEGLISAVENLASQNQIDSENISFLSIQLSGRFPLEDLDKTFEHPSLYHLKDLSIDLEKFMTFRSKNFNLKNLSSLSLLNNPSSRRFSVRQTSMNLDEIGIEEFVANTKSLRSLAFNAPSASFSDAQVIKNLLIKNKQLTHLKLMNTRFIVSRA